MHKINVSFSPLDALIVLVHFTQFHLWFISAGKDGYYLQCSPTPDCLQSSRFAQRPIQSPSFHTQTIWADETCADPKLHPSQHNWSVQIQCPSSLWDSHFQGIHASEGLIISWADIGRQIHQRTLKQCAHDQHQAVKTAQIALMAKADAEKNQAVEKAIQKTKAEYDKKLAQMAKAHDKALKVGHETSIML